jgi:hypothetical protein
VRAIRWYIQAQITMTTKLDGPLRRELTINGEPYTVTISPDGFKLVPKGRRKGYELDWRSFVSGEAALVSALNASLEQAPAASGAAGVKPAAPRRQSTKRAKSRARPLP